MSKEIDWQKIQKDSGLNDEEFTREIMTIAGDCMKVMLERVGDTGLTAKHVAGDETFILTFRKG